MFYALTAMEDYYSEKLSIFVALAPVAFFNHCTSGPVNILSTQVLKILGLTKAFQINHVP